METTVDAGVTNILVTLYWDVIDPPKDMDSVFVHLETDRIWGQGDSIPVCNLHPTDRWTPGEIVVDRHLLRLDPTPPPGDYPLTVGMYRWDTGARLPVVNEQGAAFDSSVTLTTLAIVIQKKILNREAQTQRVSKTLWVLDPKSLSEKLY